MTSKRILILGGGTMQVPAITLAKGMGLSVIVADGNENVPGRKIADFFEHIDLKDSEKLLKSALKYKKNGGLDGVFTAGTDFSVSVAKVAQGAELPGIPVQAAVNASNKFVMRKVLSEEGIPVPRFILAADKGIDEDCRQEIGELEFPLVVKPVDNMGARGISKIDNCRELKTAVKSARKYSKTGQVIVEEYLEGPEFSLDALIYDDEIYICGIADRHIFFPPYFIEMGHTIPSNFNPLAIEEIINVFKRGIMALGITEGAAKGDIKWSRDAAYVGEIAARLSGGYMSGWTYPYSSGVEVTRSAIRIALGLPPVDISPVFNKTSAERAFISIPGTVEEVVGKEEVFDIPPVRHVFVRAAKGEPVSFPVNNVEKAGNCIAVADTRKEAVYAAEQGCRKIFVRLKPNDPRTESFLFGEKPPWIPPAFSLELEENIAALRQMSFYVDSRASEIIIPALPDMKGETVTDWHGKKFLDAFKDVKYHTGCGECRFDETPKGIFPGNVFYRAFLTGGIQGGVWLIETIKLHLKKGGNIKELLGRWCE